MILIPDIHLSISTRPTGARATAPDETCQTHLRALRCTPDLGEVVVRFTFYLPLTFPNTDDPQMIAVFKRAHAIHFVLARDLFKAQL
jgi:hypothetical protein